MTSDHYSTSRLFSAYIAAVALVSCVSPGRESERCSVSSIAEVLSAPLRYDGHMFCGVASVHNDGRVVTVHPLGLVDRDRLKPLILARGRHLRRLSSMVPPTTSAAYMEAVVLPMRDCFLQPSPEPASPPVLCTPFRYPIILELRKFQLQAPHP